VSRYGQEFPLLHVVQAGSGAHSTPVKWVPSALSTEVKGPGREAEHSHPSSAEIKNGGAMPLLMYLHSIMLSLSDAETTSSFYLQHNYSDGFPNSVQLNAGLVNFIFVGCILLRYLRTLYKHIIYHIYILYYMFV
jgi:hypothetical protein